MRIIGFKLVLFVGSIFIQSVGWLPWKLGIFWAVNEGVTADWAIGRVHTRGCGSRSQSHKTQTFKCSICFMLSDSNQSTPVMWHLHSGCPSAPEMVVLYFLFHAVSDVMSNNSVCVCVCVSACTCVFMCVHARRKRIGMDREVNIRNGRTKTFFILWTDTLAFPPFLLFALVLLQQRILIWPSTSSGAAEH